MKTTAYTISLLTLFLGLFLTPAAAHASILGTSDSFIRTSIDTGKGNMLQNRDNRNELLEKMQTEGIKILTPEERQALLLQQLSVTVANLQNIHDRIGLDVAAESADGRDLSEVTALLSIASDEITFASSSIAAITASSTTTTASPYSPYPALMNTINSVNSAKSTLQEALDDLEQTI